jgi:hypothetical protein
MNHCRASSDDSSYIMVSGGREQSSFMLPQSVSSTPLSEMFDNLRPVNPLLLHTGRTQSESNQASWVHPRLADEETEVNENFATHSGTRVTEEDSASPRIGEYLDPLTTTATVRIQSVSAPLSPQFAHSSDDLAVTLEGTESAPAVYGYSSNALNEAVGVFLVFTTSERCRKVELMLELEPTEAEPLS